MKKILKPAQKEESIYFSDVSGKLYGEFPPPVELKISFNYGSKYDGAEIKIDMDDDEVQSLIEVLKNTVSDDFKSNLNKNLNKYEKNFEDSMQMRDWDHCDMFSNNILFCREFLGKKND